MMFRKLYWVTEQLGENGISQVNGVFTSIPDLVRKGLKPREGDEMPRLRLSLVKLDSDKAPFGSWQSPEFEGIQAGLQQFVLTDEFSEDHCSMLISELEKFSHATV